MHCLELFLQLQKQLRMNEIFVLMTGVIVSSVQVQKFLSKMRCYAYKSRHLQHALEEE
jgi:hypothetical protein